jgi:hypothetical protein
MPALAPISARKLKAMLETDGYAVIHEDDSEGYEVLTAHCDNVARVLPPDAGDQASGR